jgi:hypothetical protein
MPKPGRCHNGFHIPATKCLGLPQFGHNTVSSKRDLGNNERRPIMATEDRFTPIAATAAVLITAGLFLWTHWGHMAFLKHHSRPTRSVVATSPTEEPGPVDVNPPDPQPSSAVIASFEVDPGGGNSFVQTSSPTDGPDDRTLAILEDIASGWKGSHLPAPSEILVRRDSDGRMIVAAGTHKRYNTLRREMDGLDPVEVDDALRQATASPDEAETLRTLLITNLDACLSVDIPEVEPDMIAGTSAWQFADSGFRSLSPMQRHLLLMGRRNARMVQQKLAEIRQQLNKPGITTTEPPLAPPVVIAQSLPAESPFAELAQP